MLLPFLVRRAEAEPGEENREDDRERVNRRAEQQGEVARPNHLGGEGAEAGERDRDQDRTRTMGRRRHRCRGSGRLVRSARRDDEGEECDARIDGDRRIRRGRHIVEPEQIESGEQAPRDGADRVAAVEISQPRNPARRRFDSARDGRKRGAHEHGGRKQADYTENGAQQQARHAVAEQAGVPAADDRHGEEDDQRGEGDPEFEDGVDAQRMVAGRDQPGQGEASEAHAAHEGTQQHRHRNG